VKQLDYLFHVGNPNEENQTSGSGNENGYQLDRECHGAISGRFDRKREISDETNGSEYLHENSSCLGLGFL
jgi:hypothetical protein